MAKDTPLWSSTTAYYSGQRVTRNGKVYEARYFSSGVDPENNHEPEQGHHTGTPWSCPLDV